MVGTIVHSGLSRQQEIRIELFPLYFHFKHDRVGLYLFFCHFGYGTEYRRGIKPSAKKDTYRPVRDKLSLNRITKELSRLLYRFTSGSDVREIGHAEITGNRELVFLKKSIVSGRKFLNTLKH